MTNNLSKKTAMNSQRAIGKEDRFSAIGKFSENELQNDDRIYSNVNFENSNSPPPVPAKSPSIRSKIADSSLNEGTCNYQPNNPFRNFSNKISNKVNSVKEKVEKFNLKPNLNLTGGIHNNYTAEPVYEYQSINDYKNSIYESLNDYGYQKDEIDMVNKSPRQTSDRRLNSGNGGTKQIHHSRTPFDLEKKIEEILEQKMREKLRVGYTRPFRSNKSNHDFDCMSEEDFDREVNARVEKILSSQLSKYDMNDMCKNEKPDKSVKIDEKIIADLEAMMEKRKKKEENTELEKKSLVKEINFAELENHFDKKLMEALEKQKTELMLEKQKEEILLEKQKAELELQKQKDEIMLEKHKIELMLDQQKAQTMLKDENYRIITNVPNWQKNIQQSNNNEDIYESRSDYQSHDSRKGLYSNKSSNRPTINFSGNKGGEFQILLLGGTGTGKSTLINTMANYFLGGNLPNPKVVIPTRYFRATEKNFGSVHSEASIDDVTKSKTTKCRNYSFTHPQNSGLKFVFIDSPGLSDTNGTKQDDENIQEIINMAISAGSLAALVVIANGTEARVTPSIRNTLVRLANNLPDVVVDSNLLLVLTKCSKNSACFSEEAFADEISKPKAMFYMDNQAFCSDPRTWQDDEDAYEELQLKFEQSNRTFDKLLQQITGMSNTSTEAFKAMKDLRDKLKSQIATISLDIANIQKVQDSLEAAQKALKLTGDQKNSFKNFKKSETITLKKIVPASYHSTVCTTHFLKDIICHQHCGLEFSNKAGNNIFSGCACMGANSKCTQCGCGPEAHYHAMVQLETKTETIDKVLQDIKAKYDMADQDFNKFSSDANSFQSTLNNLQAAADQKYKQIHQLCYDLSKICSRFNFVDELHANIENMKQEARVIKNNNLRKNAEDEIAKLTKLANDLSVGQKRPVFSKASNHSPAKQIMNNLSFGSIGSSGSSNKAKGFMRDLFKK